MATQKASALSAVIISTIWTALLHVLFTNRFIDDTDTPKINKTCSLSVTFAH